jgi:hypothetical protein
MARKLTLPYRYEMMIGEEHKGKMDPKLIRWCIENKKEVEYFRERTEERFRNGYVTLDNRTLKTK